MIVIALHSPFDMERCRLSTKFDLFGGDCRKRSKRLIDELLMDLRDDRITKSAADIVLRHTLAI